MEGCKSHIFSSLHQLFHEGQKGRGVEEKLHISYNDLYEDITENSNPKYLIYVYQQHLYDNLRSILREKWKNIALVSALLLSIALPGCLDPPGHKYSSDDDDEALQTLYLYLSGLSSLFLVLSIYYVFQLLDALELHVTCEEEILHFIRNHVHDLDIPLILMNAGTVTFFLSFLVGTILVYELFAALVFSGTALIIFVLIVSRAWSLLGKTAERAAGGLIYEEVEKVMKKKKVSIDLSPQGQKKDSDDKQDGE